MKILYFDMEFANGQVPGSVYSFGYVMADENFNLLMPQKDILINPDCKWNEYVERKILVYPMEQISAAPKFPEVYPEIRALFDEAEIAVGFAIGNDARELRQACERYGLEKIQFPFIDMEPLAKGSGEHPEAHGLAGYVTAYCGAVPENQHRSDGDALATMLLFRAICRQNHATPEMMIAAYPDCCGEGIPVLREKKKKPFCKGRRHYGRHSRRSKRTI